MQQFNFPVIIVSNNYLGSINHTLLTVAALLQKNIQISGMAFCGDVVEPTRKYIMQYTKLPLLFSIPQFEKIDDDTIAAFAKMVSINL